jgi:hypothetical protein
VPAAGPEGISSTASHLIILIRIANDAMNRTPDHARAIASKVSVHRPGWIRGVPPRRSRPWRDHRKVAKSAKIRKEHLCGWDSRLKGDSLFHPLFANRCGLCVFAVNGYPQSPWRAPVIANVMPSQRTVRHQKSMDCRKSARQAF